MNDFSLLRFRGWPDGGSRLRCPVLEALTILNRSRGYDARVPLIHLGLSHRSVRSAELAALSDRAGGLAARLVDGQAVVRGAVLLATCNRFELYMDATEFHSAVDGARNLIRDLADPDLPHIDPALAVYVGDGAVEHLFKVSCGLDSMVVGEHEIAGQVRQALADSDATASPVLRRLFQAALTTSKAVASGTTLGGAGRSLASVGLDLIARRFGSFGGRNVLLQGTGAYAGVVVAELIRRDAGNIRVHSGTGRAAAFAQSHPPVVPVHASGLPDSLRWADVVVCCSGTSTRSLTVDLLADARRGRPEPLPILDLALAGDVPADVDELADVVVVDLDEVARNAPPERAAAVSAALSIVDKGVAAFQHTEGGRQADPAVTAMRAYVSSIIEAEVQSAERRHSPETAEAVARSLRRVSNALLHTPSIRAAALARSGDVDDYRNALHTLFGIDVEAGR